MTIAQYDAHRPAKAKDKVRTLCHAPFTTLDLGPQGQVTTCNHFHRFLGNLNERSWLDVFRGEEWSRLRQNMLDYRISEMDCRHCARQIRSGHPGNAFAQEHFDSYPAETATPRYPSVIIFRLSNVCNLMCVMCNGTLSHRIRKERENLPPLPPPPYDEKFFAEMEETLPHVKYVEFYGGEPFLVKEHLRILDILEKTKAKTEIYVNTNGTAITERIRGYIERLNFIKIAVSVDAIFEEIHARQRVGIKHDVCMENLQWLLDLRRRKNVWVGLNTTETRFNWYHLPVMYEWAARKDVYIHINTCLHPSDTTLYDLPTEELSYIGDYFARARNRLGAALQVRGNQQSYGHLEAMVRDELTARRNGTKRPNPYPTDREPIHGGLMSVPELKQAPFDTPAAARVELAKVQEFEAWDFAFRLATAWLLALGDSQDAWAGLRGDLERLRDLAKPLAERANQHRRSDDDMRAIRTAWRQEQANQDADVLATLCEIPDDSAHIYTVELLRARALRRLGNFEQAQDTLYRAFGRAPTAPSAFVELAWLCLDVNDVEGGRGHARRARELTPADADPGAIAAWAHALGVLAVRAGDKAEALDALHALERARPDDSITTELRNAIERIDEMRDRFRIESAWRLERSGRFDEAIAAVGPVDDRSPLAYEARMPQARALRRSGQFAAARELLGRAIASHPQRPEAHVELAWLCFDTDAVEEGLAHARRASLLPGAGHAPAHALAALAIVGDRAEDAATALAGVHADRKVAAGAANPGGHEADERERAAIARGWEHEARGDFEATLTCAGEVPQQSPWLREALVLRARALRRRGDRRGALRTLALSIAIEPVQLEALVELAWAAHDAGDGRSGIAYARRARELSVASGNPFGVVGWAHPLGLLAGMARDASALADARAALDSVREIEDRAPALLAEITAAAARLGLAAV